MSIVNRNLNEDICFQLELIRSEGRQTTDYVITNSSLAKYVKKKTS